MISLREKLNAISELANEAEGDIPDLLDQCYTLDSLADDVDNLEGCTVDDLVGEIRRIAGAIRDQAQSIRDEMGQ